MVETFHSHGLHELYQLDLACSFHLLLAGKYISLLNVNMLIHVHI